MTAVSEKHEQGLVSLRDYVRNASQGTCLNPSFSSFSLALAFQLERLLLVERRRKEKTERKQKFTLK